jgi:Transcriptional regulator/sugar kinase
MQRVRIGIDIGGTNMRAAIVDTKGQILGQTLSIATNARLQKEIIIDNLITMIHSLISSHKNIEIEGIGIGCTGPVDSKRGIILDVCNLPTLNYFHLNEVLEKEFGCVVKLDNDANAFTLGEALWGAGKNASSVLGLTLGTGLGCAIVTNGKIWHGKNDCACEIWTSPYKNGIIEDYVSGNAVSNLYGKKTGETLTSYQVAVMARHNEKAALDVWHDFSKDLAYAIAWCVNMFDPEIIVLGGSLVKSYDLFGQETDALFRNYVCKPLQKNLKLVIASLGDDSGVVGAASLL